MESEQITFTDASNCRIDIITDPEKLDSYADQWDHLLGLAKVGLPMHTYGWIKAHLQNFRDEGQRWLCLFAFKENQLISVLPIMHSHKQSWHRLEKLTTPINWHTYSSGLLLHPGNMTIAMESIIYAIAKLFPSWAYLNLTRLTDDSDITKVIRHDNMNLTSSISSGGRGAMLDVTGEFDQYRQKLGKNLRKLLKKCMKKVSLDSTVEFLDISDPNQNQSVLDDFLRLEKSGWKGERGSAIGMSEKLRAFYTSMTRNMISRGHLEYRFLKLNGESIASQLTSIIGNRRTISKIAYDEKYSEFSPGNLLFEATLKSDFDNPNIHYVDCLTDMEWHLKWNLEYRNYVNIHLFPKRILPRILFSYPHKLIEKAKKYRQSKS